MNTISVSPITLKLGDRVLAHGAVVEVAHITESADKTPGAVRVAACTSRLIGEENGSIPRGWFQSPESLRAMGCTWAKDLPDGRYWNVQGNAFARVLKIVDDTTEEEQEARDLREQRRDEERDYFGDRAEA